MAVPSTNENISGFYRTIDDGAGVILGILLFALISAVSSIHDGLTGALSTTSVIAGAAGVITSVAAGTFVVHAMSKAEAHR